MTALFAPLILIASIVACFVSACAAFIFIAWAITFIRAIVWDTLKGLALMVVVVFNFFCSLFGNEN